MTKIILNGCFGKMGRTISAIAKNLPDVTIVAGVDKYKDESFTDYPVFDEITKCEIEADALLDFSRPNSLESLMEYSKSKRLPIVICTTGFTSDQLNYIEESSKTIPVFHSANMSIGVNVVNSVLKQISAFLYENYDIEIVEKHHNQKVDSPSGTALLLANTIKQAIPQETEFTYGREGIAKRERKEIGIHAVRGGSIVGEHEVIFAGQGEVIEIKHTALSREVFAVGSLKACKYMHSKAPGLYDMNDVVNS
jgi:4-hydroxy-tetrahydrodipicolinate reductase